jgi:hypothetical protein
MTMKVNKAIWKIKGDEEICNVCLKQSDGVLLLAAFLDLK